jgi:hypothetical protein
MTPQLAPLSPERTAESGASCGVFIIPRKRDKNLTSGTGMALAAG